MHQYSRLRSYQSKKFVNHQKFRKYLIFFVASISIVILLFCLSKLSYLEVLTIKDIKITGTSLNIENIIKDKIKKELQGSYFGIFSRANTFLFPQQNLVANIQSSIPLIRSLDIHRDGITGLRVDVVEKNRAGKVCASLPEFSDEHVLIETENCYFVDWSGVIFEKAEVETSTSNNQTNTKPNLYFIPNLTEILSTGKSLLSKSATSTSEFVSLQNFYNGVKDAGLNPKYILFKDNGEYEMYANDVVIYFSNLKSLEKQLENLVSFWKNSKVRNNNPNVGFEYIDVRFDSNVFYRLIQ